jgi:hypothetical protein
MVGAKKCVDARLGGAPVSDEGVEQHRGRAAAIREQMYEFLRETDPFRRELRARIAAVRKWWADFPIDPTPLSEAHRLCAEAEIEEAWIADLLDLCRGPSIFKFPPGEAGRFVFTDFAGVVRRLQPNITAALRAGRLVASGIDPEKAVSGKSAIIPAKRWSILVPDFERSAATCEGRMVAIGITVEIKESGLSHFDGRISARRIEKVIRDWYFNERLPQIEAQREAGIGKPGKRDGRDLDLEAAREKLPGFTESVASKRRHWVDVLWRWQPALPRRVRH